MENALSQRGLGAKWNEFAEKDAFGYIMTDLVGADPRVFWQSGNETVQEELLPILTEFKVSGDIGLEIGCGVGRLVLPLCSVFRDMIGADISEGMIRRAKAFASGKRLTNARFVRVAEPAELLVALEDAARRVTFIYSLLVFQHIADFRTIDAYLAAISRLLSRDGVAYIQFDTRPATLPYHLKTALPDSMLPRLWRRGVRRIRQNSSEIERSLAEKGLKILEEKTPRTAYHRYILKVA